MLRSNRHSFFAVISAIAILLTVLTGSATAHIASNYGGNHTFRNTGTGVTATADDTVTDGHCTYAGVWDGAKWFEGPRSCGAKEMRWHNTIDNPRNGFGYGCITGHWDCTFKKQWSS